MRFLLSAGLKLVQRVLAGEGCNHWKWERFRPTFRGTRVERLQFFKYMRFLLHNPRIWEEAKPEYKTGFFTKHIQKFISWIGFSFFSLSFLNSQICPHFSSFRGHSKTSVFPSGQFSTVSATFCSSLSCSIAGQSWVLVFSPFLLVASRAGLTGLLKAVCKESDECVACCQCC